MELLCCQKSLVEDRQGYLPELIKTKFDEGFQKIYIALLQNARRLMWLTSLHLHTNIMQFRWLCLSLHFVKVQCNFFGKIQQFPMQCLRGYGLQNVELWRDLQPGSFYSPVGLPCMLTSPLSLDDKNYFHLVNETEKAPQLQ